MQDYSYIKILPESQPYDQETIFTVPKVVREAVIEVLLNQYRQEDPWFRKDRLRDVAVLINDCKDTLFIANLPNEKGIITMPVSHIYSNGAEVIEAKQEI